MTHRIAILGASGYTGAELVRLMPDRDLPAADLVRIGAELRAAGVERVVISTLRVAE